MPDNTLQFETRVDLSGLNSGMDAAKARVSTFGGDVKSAMAAAAVATQQLADAQIALGASAEAGNAQAAAVILEYQQAVNEASAAVRSFAETEVEETVAVRAGTSARMAASAELRVFEGNMQGSTRAAAAFLSQLPGIGAAMQAAFPVFGAIAVAEILVQVAEKIHNVYNEYYNLYSLQQSVWKNILSDETEEISLSNQRLSQLREQRVLAAELTGPKQGRSNRGQQAGAKFDTHIDTVDLKNAQDLVTATTARIRELQTAAQGTDVAHALGQGGVIITKEMTLEAREAAKLIPQVTEDLQKYTDQVTTLQQKMQTDTMRSSLAGREATEKETPKTPKINQIQLDIEELNKRNQINEQFHEHIQAMWMEDYRAQMEAYNKGEQADRERTELFKKNQKDQADSAIAAANEVHNINLSKIDTAQAASTTAQSTALIKNPEQQLEALRTFHAEAEAENVRFTQEEIDIANNTGQLDKARELQQQLNAVRRKGNQEWLTDTEKISIQVNQKYQQFATTLNTDFTRAFDGVINKTETAQKAFSQMFDQIETSLVNFVVKWVLQQTEMWAFTAAAALTGNTTLKTINMSQIKMDAGVAAGNTFAAVSAIPVVGPALAPAAAFAAYGAVMAFEAFEQGGIVGGASGMPVPIMAHAGERVLTAGQTNKFESLVNNGGSSSSNVNLHYNPQINGIDKSGMRAILQSHADDLHAIVRSGIRSGAIGARG